MNREAKRPKGGARVLLSGLEVVNQSTPCY